MLALGVDGARVGGSSGWIAALVPTSGGTPVSWRSCATAGEVLSWVRHAQVAAVGIDIPIGLPDGEPRTVDLVAKKRLVGASSSVFPTAPRAVVEPELTFAEANARAREITGQGLSQQAFGLFPRIRDVDRMLDDPALHDLVAEVHPELSFRALGEQAGVPITASKKTAAGVGQRLAALNSWLRSLQGETVEAVGALTGVPVGVPVDDALDAMAAAWSAARWRLGNAEVLPADPPPVDGKGRPMRMIV